MSSGRSITTFLLPSVALANKNITHAPQIQIHRMARPLWALALTSVLSDLAEQDMETFCMTFLNDSKIRDRMRRELLHQPRHLVSELAETDIVEIVSASDQWSILGELQNIQQHDVKLVHLGAIPFRIREAIKQLFRERGSVFHKTPLLRDTSDGRFEVWVNVDYDTDLSDVYEVFEDAYMRAVDKTVSAEDIPYPYDFEEVDITDRYSVLPDTLLYDAYDFTLNDRATQIREAFLENCVDFFSSPDAPVLPETVQPLTVAFNQVWVRKPRVRLILAASKRLA